MKVALAWMFASPLHALGHLCWLLCERFDWIVPVFFRPYQTFMRWSYRLEQWAGTDFVWKKQ